MYANQKATGQMASTEFVSQPTIQISQPAVLLGGDSAQPEFAAAVELLRTTACLRCVASLVEAAQLIETNDSLPDAVVLAQARPGENGSQTARRIQSAAPKVELRALLGTWCEGETRTGMPWLGIDRLYWYEFPGWWQRFLGRWTTIRASKSACTVTSNHDGQMCPSPHGLTIVAASCRESFQAIADSLSQAGFASIWSLRHGRSSVAVGPVAGIWEGGQLTDAEIPHLRSFCTSLGHCARYRVALLDFPRLDRARLAHQMGATTVLGKPWQQEDLWQALGIVPDSPAAQPVPADHGQAA